ncbi:MAG: IreB family regulatory phosphoprotein [Firmicutes bacterium]|nr:IreB family regulatory phosphoprotein [Bacillota bacterium]
MEDNWEQTRRFQRVDEEPRDARGVLLAVFQALQEKGYNPVSQIVGYLLSGDPTYITSHRGARSLIRRLERDELLEELVKTYLKQAGG